MENSVKHLHDDLVDQCLLGDRSAHEKLYRLYSRAMFNICCRIIGNEGDAEDVLQEAFVSAFKNLGTYNKNATFGAWLKRIVINKSINFVKKRKLDLEPIQHSEVERYSENEVRQEAEYDLDEIREAIDKLPDGYRIVFSLYLLEGYDHGEIGEILGISESTSKSQYNRSKKRLRELLKSKL